MKTPAHSLLGASGAYRWLNCPGSFQLSLTAPYRPSSIYAVTGTVAHDYIEKAVRDAIAQGRRPGELMVDQQRELGRVWSREGHAVTVDQDFIDGINAMLDYVREAATQSDWCNVEFRIELDDYFPKASPPPVNLFGRVDVALLDLLTETLEVIDYKNGAGVIVTPIENPQLLYYAAGVLRALPDNQRRQVRRVKLTVVQPHAPGMNPVRSWETTAIDLLMWVDDTLVPGVNACARDDPPLVPGSWCRFCPALHACPRLMQDAVDMAKREFDDVVLPNDPDELAKALDIAERALTWAGALQAHALEQLQRQVRIPGWEMVPTRPTRKWVDDESTTVGVLSTLGVSDDVIWETRLRSPAQIEKALIKTTKGRHVWQDQIADILIESKSSGVKLARSQRADAKGEFQDAE
jgi:hypothetical protein